MGEDKNWMDELKDGSSKPDLEGAPISHIVRMSGGLKGASAQIPTGYFSGIFKFQIGEKVRSRIHECNGIVEYAEMTRYVNGDQVSYKIRFNDPEVFKTETSTIDEQWLEKI